MNRSIRTIRGRVALGAAATLAATTAVLGTAGAASATAIPSQCNAAGVSPLFSVSSDGGALVCWWPATATAKICDTKTGDTPYMWIQTNSGTNSWVLAYDDGYGSGGCVWAYPTASPYREANGGTGQICFEAVDVNTHKTIDSYGTMKCPNW